jgi:hypothetical protein
MIERMMNKIEMNLLDKIYSLEIKIMKLMNKMGKEDRVGLEYNLPHFTVDNPIIKSNH